MTTQIERAKVFAGLHIKGDPLLLFNIWDAGSAQIVAALGAKALATGSWSVAAAHGFGDGEKLPFDLVIANIQRIVAVAGDDLPVTLDMEGGYAQDPDGLKANITAIIEAGAVGINFEDQIVGGEGLYNIEAQSARIAVVREAAEQSGVPFFINARTDIYLKAKPADHNAAHLEEAIARGQAYAKAGASGYFPAGLGDSDALHKLCEVSALPINVMMRPGVPSPKELAALGVARISYAAGPYRQAMEALKTAGREVLESLGAAS